MKQKFKFYLKKININQAKDKKLAIHTAKKQTTTFEFKQNKEKKLKVSPL